MKTSFFAFSKNMQREAEAKEDKNSKGYKNVRKHNVTSKE